MRTQVGDHRRRAGRADARAACSISRASSRSCSRRAAASTSSSASARACSSRGRSTCSTRRASASGMRREGLVHHGIELQFDGERHRIDAQRRWPAGAAIVVYGQTEVVKDLIAARLASGAPLLFEVDDVGVARPRRASVRRSASTHEGRRQVLECDVIAGCDGFHGVCRASDSRRGVLRTYSREYPFGWLGILAAVAPSSDELDLRPSRARLRAAQPALARAQPPLRPVPARRGHRRVAGRRASGRSCSCGSGSTAGRSPRARCSRRA